jgi:HSP20 family molecular chaperone IbpA
MSCLEVITMKTQTCLETKPFAGRTSCGRRPGALRPLADAVERESGVELTLDLPGVSQENMTLTVEQDTLIVTGQRDLALEGHAVYRESRPGEFRRAFHLADDLDADGITAQLRDGVLTIQIPKAEKARPRRIPIAGL